MEKSKLAYDILKVVEQFESRIADKVATMLLEKITEPGETSSGTESFLNTVQLCEQLQISESHFYKLKRAYKNTLPCYDINGAIRYKLSEVAQIFQIKNNE